MPVNSAGQKVSCRLMVIDFNEIKQTIVTDIYKIKSILIRGPKFWNSLPRELKDSSSVSTFKERLTSFLTNHP